MGSRCDTPARGDQPWYLDSGINSWRTYPVSYSPYCIVHDHILHTLCVYHAFTRKLFHVVLGSRGKPQRTFVLSSPCTSSTMQNSRSCTYTIADHVQ